MREIKFRAWSDGKIKEWEEVRHDHFWPLQCYETKVLMQYTGIKDKNGREIYEGDIVKFYDKDGDWFAFGVCYYDIEETSFLHTFYEVNKNKVDFRFQRPPKRFWSNKEFSFEVIGNIYENPELLE